MKKTVLLLAFMITQFVMAQTPTPVYEYLGSTTSSEFVAGTGITPTADRYGEPNGAVYLAAVHQALKLNITSQMTALMNEGTISLWFKLDGIGPDASTNLGTDKPLIFWSNGKSGYSEGLAMVLSPEGKIKIISHGGGGPTEGGSESSTVNFPNAQAGWNQFVISWKFGYAGYIKGYLNGDLVVSRVQHHVMYWASLPLIYFTGFNDGYPNSLSGSIDEIKVYTQSLTNAQIETLYNPAPFCEVEIPDLNFKSALLNHTPVIDTNNDGIIQCSEATALTGLLNVSGAQITNLTGIEAFVNITTLYAQNNQLTSLDVSANTDLQSLWVENNQLTSLNVSGNTALNTIFCQNNQLTNLDVSTNTALVGLYCGNNQITSLDVSANELLNNLDCQNNQLTSLNIANGNNYNFNFFFSHNNPDLTCIEVDNLTLSTFSWWQEEYYSKPAGASWSEDCQAANCIVNIPDTNFKNALLNYTSIVIDANNDGEIQCSEAAAFTGTLSVDNKNISNLTGIEAFTNITALYCGSNQLTSLDVSANTALTTLYCWHNQLTNLNISGNTALTNLRCQNNQLANLDVSTNTALQYLICPENQLTNLNVSANSALTLLECGSNQLTNLDVSTNTALEYFHCYDNLLTSIDISTNIALSGLEVQNNQLTNLNISNNTLLTELNCEGNSLTALDVSTNLNLQALVCSFNQLAELDLSINTALQSLIATNNQLTSLNIANGNNDNFSYFNVENNPNLTCIQIDDVSYINNYWLNNISFVIDAGASYSENCSLGTSDFDVQKINVYPNPTNGIVNISEIADVTVFDIQGRKIAESKNVTSFDLSGQTAGVYFAKITLEEGTKHIKIIKQ